MTMANQMEDAGGTLSPTCTFTFFECLTSNTERTAHKRASRRIRIERQMQVLYQQPHLVPPMKLTVFDDMPSTPLPPPQSQISQWISHTWSIASRVSQRASVSTRKRSSSKPVISKPQPAVPAEDLPLRRGREFRPLELSIYYAPDNRLSDLPKFDRLSFTEGGEIRIPPRALIRTKSADVLQSFEPIPVVHKPASMFETRQMFHVRRDTASSIVSMSRPPSEYDALHSHPVSMMSLPGLPPQVHMAHRPENSVTILSPMQEEFTPIATAMTTDGTKLVLPDEQLARQHNAFEAHDLAHEATTRPSTQWEPAVHQEEDISTSYFHTDYQTNKRIRQWITSRQHSSSISTTKSSSTTSSFAEHRRKRTQFYQLAQQQTPPPQALKLFQKPQHQRTATASTIASTTDTNILCFENFTSEIMSNASMTTAPEVQSRAGTIRSFSLPIQGARVSDDIDTKEMPPPPCYTEVMEKAIGAGIVIEEIHGPLRSPGVGIAF